jgi:hypothetical protein
MTQTDIHDRPLAVKEFTSSDLMRPTVTWLLVPTRVIVKRLSIKVVATCTHTEFSSFTFHHYEF